MYFNAGQYGATGGRLRAGAGVSAAEQESDKRAEHDTYTKHNKTLSQNRTSVYRLTTQHAMGFGHFE